MYVICFSKHENSKFILSHFYSSPDQDLNEPIIGIRIRQKSSDSDPNLQHFGEKVFKLHKKSMQLAKRSNDFYAPLNRSTFTFNYNMPFFSFGFFLKFAFSSVQCGLYFSISDA